MFRRRDQKLGNVSKSRVYGKADPRMVKWGVAIKFRAGTQEAKVNALLEDRFIDATFKIIDANSNNSISSDEMTAIFGENATLVQEAMDTDKNGNLTPIEYSRFVKTNVTKFLKYAKMRKLYIISELALVARCSGKMNKARMSQSLFTALDADKSGTISLDEITDVLGKDAKAFIAALEDGSTSVDGEIDSKEFRKWATGPGADKAHQATQGILDKAFAGIVVLIVAGAKGAAARKP